MQVVTQAEIEGRETRSVPTEDGLNVVTNYFGGEEPTSEHPHAFLVEYRPLPGKAIRPHFHKIAQFQVVIGGDGRIGKTPVPPLSFQYADPSTPYGPIAPEDEERGIDFLTLRPVSRPGIWWMPGSRHEMSGRAGRNIAAQVPPDAPLPASGAQLEDLIAPDADGLAGFVVRLAAGAEQRVAVPDGSSGQYHLVSRGTIAHEGRELDRLALIFAGPGEAIDLRAGADGAEVLVLQFPGRLEP